MTNNGLDIQTISTKQTDFQTDRVLLLDQVTEKKAKVNPSHFLKFLIASRTTAHLQATQADTQTQACKRAVFLQTHGETNFNFEIL